MLSQMKKIPHFYIKFGVLKKVVVLDKAIGFIFNIHCMYST